MFEKGADVKFKWVTGGSDEATVAPIAGDTNLLLATWAETSAYCESGDLVPIVFLSNKRNPASPDTPCSGELGVPIDLGYFRVFTAMKGTPQEAIDAFEAAVHNACSKPEWEEWLTKNGMTNDYLWDSETEGEALKSFYETAKSLFSDSASSK
jgi:tripartite-type tricarboxylate transporter receptor subunit TctC